LTFPDEMSKEERECLTIHIDHDHKTNLYPKNPIAWSGAPGRVQHGWVDTGRGEEDTEVIYKLNGEDQERRPVRTHYKATSPGGKSCYICGEEVSKMCALCLNWKAGQLHEACPSCWKKWCLESKKNFMPLRCPQCRSSCRPESHIIKASRDCMGSGSPAASSSSRP
jgi:hypothetical protein